MVGTGDDDEGGMQFDHDSLELAMQEIEAEEDAANDPLAGARLAKEKIIFLTKVDPFSSFLVHFVLL